jgi:hypothetical protein
MEETGTYTEHLLENVYYGEEKDMGITLSLIVCICIRNGRK